MQIEPTLRIGELTVHRLGFGAMRLTEFRPVRDRTEQIKVARRAVELGVDFIDTADAYGVGANEELLAEALHPYSENLVIATKVGHTRPSPSEWKPVGRPEYLRQAAELSLRRLRLERIDLLQLHRVDPLVPFADQLGALAQLQAEGKVWHIGLSEVTVEQLEQARAMVDIVSVQNRYNLTDREHDPVIEYCELHGIAFVPWLPIANGDHLARPLLVEIATEAGATPAQVSLAWLLHRSPMMVPIPGTSSEAHLVENVAAAQLELTADQLDRLDSVGSER
ncbi:aryl-alcohol dehydrogenase-like predicted oxidoreductase [Kribbella voronezhensis]|uniref:Aryl-alcohol dehydrogenase-like predicted oxidoreductase n=1 Tax=Kribbella voronezhensis TaxID=2512212 RepID=A0A4R7TB67_9ACTN|nr:aldo/keto reductase [Kribbella voronezhensis]TDU89292.1 aryl-alcohol dehydrogenase-like predicted oxidoreductase [Kribbella voronezhensis]